jgi:hypothetical protein
MNSVSFRAYLVDGESFVNGNKVVAFHTTVWFDGAIVSSQAVHLSVEEFEELQGTLSGLSLGVAALTL